jgi:hypothetical protein
MQLYSTIHPTIITHVKFSYEKIYKKEPHFKAMQTLLDLKIRTAQKKRRGRGMSENKK